MVKPSNASYRFIFTIFMGIFLLGFLFGVLVLIRSVIGQSDMLTIVVESVGLAIFTLVPALILILLLRQGARYNRRRQAASRGDSTIPIYPQQPTLQITITEEEIQIHQIGGIGGGSMEWGDARLFVVDSIVRHGDEIHYELSSKYTILRWIWHRSPRGMRPTTSVDEYNRQMEAVLAIIAAKTGLTLYDLR